MERVGLVAYVEKQLERDIALRRLPRGRLASEQKLARVFGVSRSTVREALLRLGARGLVVQHSGRIAHAVAPEISLSLENLGLVLHDEHSSEDRWLLEGFFSLKRQVLVELLADCCAKASERDLSQLGDVCFRLREAGRWGAGENCARFEFELLRLAARVADRPGYLLLIQSLQRALWGSAARLLPLMGGDPVCQWSQCATYALWERDAEAIRHTLSPLLKACDEQVLERFAQAPREQAVPEDCHAPSPVHPAVPVSAPPDAALVAPSGLESHDLGCPAAAAESAEDTPRLQPEALLAVPDGAALLVTDSPGIDAGVESAQVEPPIRRPPRIDSQGRMPGVSQRPSRWWDVLFGFLRGLFFKQPDS
jgi:GntR family transcriptional regulator, transcriptional repressor for pyruvate dehydrogenase complex